MTGVEYDRQITAEVLEHCPNENAPKNKYLFSPSGGHYIFIDLIFRYFDIDISSFKKPRHAKKFFKKYLQPILKEGRL